jgi:hypothetical protein
MAVIPAMSPILGKGGGRLKPRSTKRYQPQFSPQRFTSDSVLAARLNSPTKLLSAMRYQFGGHLEKADGKSKVA